MPEQVLEREIKNKPLCTGFLCEVYRKLISLKLAFIERQLNFCMIQLLLFSKIRPSKLGMWLIYECGLPASVTFRVHVFKWLVQ